MNKMRNTSKRDTDLEERYGIMLAHEHEAGEHGNLTTEQSLQLSLDSHLGPRGLLHRRGRDWWRRSIKRENHHYLDLHLSVPQANLY
ncbi:unnamed protein product [Urochloa humidicola]